MVLMMLCTEIRFDGIYGSNNMDPLITATQEHVELSKHTDDPYHFISGEVRK